MANDPYSLTTSGRIDYAYLPTPKVFEEFDFEAVLADAIKHVEDREVADSRPVGQILESHTFAKVLEATTYLKELLMHRINEAVQAVLVSHSTGSDLEALGAFYGVTRQLLEPIQPGFSGDPVVESDDELRRRIALAPERLSLAATLTSYVFFALSANDKPTEVRVEKASSDEVVVRYKFEHSYLAASIVDASAYSPAPGEVVVVIMGRGTARVPSSEVVSEIRRRINQPWAKPLTDSVTVMPVQPVPYKIDARLFVYPGVDQQRVVSDARERLNLYLKHSDYIGRDITLDGIRGALMGQNIHSIDLRSPSQHLTISPAQVAVCEELDVRLGGTDV